MSLTVRILLALAGGLGLGTLMSSYGLPGLDALLSIAEPVGNLWMNALRMTVIPLIFTLLIVELTATAESMKTGGLTARALIIITAMMTLSAAMTAIFLPPILEMFPVAADAAAALKAGIKANVELPGVAPISEWLANIVPTNPVEAGAKGDILPLVIFALAFGFALTRIEGEAKTQTVNLFRTTKDAMLIIVDWALKLAPIGVFALSFMLGGRTGLGALGALGHYVLIASGSCIVMGLLSYPIAIFGGRQNPLTFIKAAVPSQALAISTQSSLACLPAMIEASTHALKIPERVAGLVLPLAVSLLRFTGPACNYAVALYVGHVYGMEFTVAQLVAGAGVAVVTSMGAVSLPGQISFFTSCAPICFALGIPIELLPLLIAVETIPDIFRTWGNVTGDLAATAAAARGEPVSQG